MSRLPGTCNLGARVGLVLACLSLVPTEGFVAKKMVVELIQGFASAQKQIVLHQIVRLLASPPALAGTVALLSVGQIV